MKSKFLAVVGIVFAFFLFSQSQKLVDYLVREAPSDSTDPSATKELGQMTVVAGEISISGTGSSELPPREGEKIYHGSRLMTGADGSVILRFTTGEIVELANLTELLVEEAADNSVFLTLISGRLRPQQQIKNSKIRVLKNLSVLTLDELIKESQIAEVASNQSAPIPTPAPTAEDNNTAQEIQTIMATQKYWLDKCFANHLKSNPQGKGEVRVFFRLKNGVVDEAKIHQSSFNDETMDACVLQIVRRTSFRRIKGDSQEFIFPFQFSSQ